jgi:hypothetical protein
MDGGNADGLQKQSLPASRDIRTSLYGTHEHTKLPPQRGQRLMSKKTVRGAR